MNRSQSVSSILLAWFFLGAAGTHAQAQAAPAAPDKNVIKARLASQERRADLLLDEIKAIDSRIEDRIDNLLATLRMVGDSKDSRTKVTRMKEQTTDGLQKSIAYYQQKRAWLQEEMRRPTFNLTADEKRRIIARFDERIEKRVNQILEISKSLPSHQDYDRYQAVGNSGWHGGVTYVESEDYKQNQRLATHTNGQRDKIIKGLQSSIEKLGRQNQSLARQQAAAGSEQLRLALIEEQRKNDELMKVRQTQLKDVFASPGTPTRPISGKEAQALDNTTRQAIDSLRRDFTTLFQRYTVWLGEQSSVNTLKAALAAAK